MQVLFERAIRPIDCEASLSLNAEDLGEMDAEFARVLLQGVVASEAELKRMIEQHAPGWTFDRMDPIARATLLIGAYELLHAREVPPAVVMNEAIEIAKEYGTSESGKFVNGVLNAIAHANAR